MGLLGKVLNTSWQRVTFLSLTQGVAMGLIMTITPEQIFWGAGFPLWGVSVAMITAINSSHADSWGSKTTQGMLILFLATLIFQTTFAVGSYTTNNIAHIPRFLETFSIIFFLDFCAEIIMWALGTLIAFSPCIVLGILFGVYSYGNIRRAGLYALIAAGMVIAVNATAGLSLWFLSDNQYNIWSNIVAIKILVLPFVYFAILTAITILLAKTIKEPENKFKHAIIMSVFVYEFDLMLLFIIMNYTTGFGDPGILAFLFPPVSLILWWLARLNVRIAGVTKTR